MALTLRHLRHDTTRTRQYSNNFFSFVESSRQLVVSAGNGNCDISGDGWQAYDTVVSVAASNHKDQRESYSSYGAHVDISGPAGGVLTTDISGDAGYGSYDGDNDYWAGFSGTSAWLAVLSGAPRPRRGRA